MVAVSSHGRARCVKFHSRAIPSGWVVGGLAGVTPLGLETPQMGRSRSARIQGTAVYSRRMAERPRKVAFPATHASCPQTRTGPIDA